MVRYDDEEDSGDVDPFPEPRIQEAELSQEVRNESNVLIHWGSFAVWVGFFLARTSGGEGGNGGSGR